MKTLLYFFLVSVLLCLANHATIAQRATSLYSGNAFDKGTKQVTAYYGYSQGELLKNRNVFGIHAGYYVINRLLIGVAGSLTKEWLGDLHTKDNLSAGPLIRYQFTSSRLSPFAELTYQLGKPTITPNVNQAVLFTPGINFSLLSHVRIEASYGLLFIPNRAQIGQPQLGATILFGNKRKGDSSVQ